MQKHIIIIVTMLLFTHAKAQNTADHNSSTQTTIDPVCAKEQSMKAKALVFYFLKNQFPEIDGTDQKTLEILRNKAEEILALNDQELAQQLYNEANTPGACSPALYQMMLFELMYTIKHNKAQS